MLSKTHSNENKVFTVFNMLLWYFLLMEDINNNNNSVFKCNKKNNTIKHG